MKNLKRALCLALTFVMLLGMMVMTTSAAKFTDSDEIANTEAVDTLVALNVINGKEDGSYFDPAGIVTRAELAKMICVALNGGKDPQLGATSYSFTDTAGHWAAGYIEYCVNLGIVAGRGDGTFDPNATVTGTEAAKMLLVAIGYNAENEGFVGNSWAISVNVRANQKDLYAELATLNPSAGLSRDNAAQMVYNAIDATMVEYEYKLTTVNGTLTTVAVVKDTTGTIISKKFALDTAYGTLDGFTYDSTAKKWTYSISVASGTLSGAVRSTSDFTELYGRSVRVLSKATSSGTTIYGIFADDSKVLATGILGDVTLTSGVTNSFKFGGTTYKMDSGALATTKVWAFNADQSVASPICTLASITTAVKPYAVSLIDDDNDGLVDFAVAVPFTVEKVTYVGSTTFTTSTGSVTKADVSVYDGIAKNDFVIVVNSAYTATQKTTYTKATVISGEATSTKDSGATFQIGGTWYKLADSSALISGSLTTAVAGSKYEKVAVVNGYAFNLVGSTATAVSDYAVVTAAAGAYGLVGDQAKLLFTDGTTKVVDTAADYTTLVDKLVTYTIDSDGDYVLSAADADVSAATAGFDTVVAAPAGSGSAITASYTYASGGDSKIGSSYIASDAVIFIKGTSWKVITGAALAKTGTSAITGVTNAYANTSSSTGFSSVALAVVTGTTTSGDVSHGYVTATPAIVKVDNKLVYQVTFWDGTKNVTANTTQLASSLSTLAKNSVITFTYDDQDINVSNVTALTSGTSGIGAVTGLSAKQIQFAYGVATEDIDNDSTLEDVISTASKTAVCSITDDTVIIYIDRENSAGVAGSALQLATGTAGSNKLANVYYELNGTDVTLLIVDVQNDILNVQ